MGRQLWAAAMLYTASYDILSITCTCAPACVVYAAPQGFGIAESCRSAQHIQPDGGLVMHEFHQLIMLRCMTES